MCDLDTWTGMEKRLRRDGEDSRHNKRMVVDAEGRNQANDGFQERKYHVGFLFLGDF